MEKNEACDCEGCRYMRHIGRAHNKFLSGLPQDAEIDGEMFVKVFSFFAALFIARLPDEQRVEVLMQTLISIPQMTSDHMGDEGESDVSPTVIHPAGHC